MSLGHKGVTSRNSASQTTFGEENAKNAEAGTTPGTGETRIDYGKITDVNYEKSQVKVLMFRDKNKGGDFLIMNGSFLPMMTPLSQIHLLWGALRPGLACRIHWKGANQPQQAVIEVIGDEETSDFLTQPIRINEMTTGPHKILSGGMSP